MKFAFTESDIEALVYVEPDLALYWSTYFAPETCGESTHLFIELYQSILGDLLSWHEKPAMISLWGPILFKLQERAINEAMSNYNAFTSHRYCCRDARYPKQDVV